MLSWLVLICTFRFGMWHNSYALPMCRPTSGFDWKTAGFWCVQAMLVSLFHRAGICRSSRCWRSWTGQAAGAAFGPFGDSDQPEKVNHQQIRWEFQRANLTNDHNASKHLNLCSPRLPEPKPTTETAERPELNACLKNWWHLKWLSRFGSDSTIKCGNSAASSLTEFFRAWRKSSSVE